MSGLFLFGVIGLYLFVLSKVSEWITVFIKRAATRKLARSGFVVLMLVLPLADEIVGAYQFKALCRENAVLKIDAERIKGKTVRLVINPSNETVPGTALRILHTRYSFFDPTSNAVLGKFDAYGVKGGWLIRSLGISNSNSPIVLGKHWCAPPLSITQLQKEYSFTVADQHLGERK